MWVTQCYIPVLANRLQLWPAVMSLVCVHHLSLKEGKVWGRSTGIWKFFVCFPFVCVCVCVVNTCFMSLDDKEQMLTILCLLIPWLMRRRPRMWLYANFVPMMMMTHSSEGSVCEVGRLRYFKVGSYFLDCALVCLRFCPSVMADTWAWCFAVPVPLLWLCDPKHTRD